MPHSSPATAPRRGRGRPTISQSDADRCEALTVMTQWKIDNKREERCPFTVRWLVQGHGFCRHHAVLESFAIGMERGDIKRVAPMPPVSGHRVRTIKARKP